MTTHQPDPSHQSGITTPTQTAPAAFSPPIPHPLAPLPTQAVQQALEALQRPAGTQPSGAVVACGGADGAPVCAVAIGHPATVAGSVPVAAPAADLTPPANPPAGPSASSPAPADGPADGLEPAAALSSWRVVVAVCVLLTVAVVGGVLAVVYPRMALFWEVISVAASLVSAAATVATTIASRDRRRGNRR